MVSLLAKLGEGGRLVILAEYRRALGVEEGRCGSRCLGPCGAAQCGAGKRGSGTPLHPRAQAARPTRWRLSTPTRSSTYRAGALRKEETRKLGLSFGDRACLAFGRRLGWPVLTTDRDWKKLEVGWTCGSSANVVRRKKMPLTPAPLQGQSSQPQVSTWGRERQPPAWGSPPGQPPQSPHPVAISKARQTAAIFTGPTVPTKWWSLS